MTRAAVAFPGRGSYGPPSLGSLPAGHAWVAARRRAARRPPASSRCRDRRAERFDPAVHLRPTNGWPLVFLCSLLDAERIADDHEVVVVVASSTGWYTALAASGVLGFDDAFRLVQEMAAAAEAPLPRRLGAGRAHLPAHRRGLAAGPARIAGLRDALEEATGARRSRSTWVRSRSSPGRRRESTRLRGGCRR